MDRAIALFLSHAQELAYLAVVFACLTLIEIRLPCWGQRPSIRSRLKSALFWVAGIGPRGLLLMAIAPLIRGLFGRPVLPELLPGWIPHPISVVIELTLAVFASDFVYYWCHRLQHTVPALWRLHAVHHSVREMSGTSAYHHFTEGAMRALLYWLPLSYLATDPFDLPVVGLIIGVQGHYLHSPTKLNFGPLGRLFIDNRFHRAHHSIHPEHHDKNFGVLVTVWDVLFGTAVFLKPGEWPDTGVSDVPEPETVVDYLIGPFRPSTKPIVAPAE